MQYRTLGATRLRVSAISLGAGPVSGLWTGDNAAQQRATLETAIKRGLNWIDTAAGYGNGASESNLGARLTELRPGDGVHVATKVRLLEPQLGDIRRAVRDSFHASLKRLGGAKVTLFQLHNAITRQPNEIPTSLVPAQILAPGGVLEAMSDLVRDGLADYLGLTGIGHADALRKVIATGQFAAIQAPFHLLNPSASVSTAQVPAEDDLDGIFDDCKRMNMGVFAIRVLAGGALAGNPPSEYTHRTKFFTLAQYERDQRRAAALARSLPADLSLAEAAVRFSLSPAGITSAIIGLASPEEVEQAVAWAEKGPLPAELTTALLAAAEEAL
jgi:aryl-alcohol dehydrogenase-like predicted oxidoreductase